MDAKIAIVAGAVGVLAGCAGTADGSSPTSPTETETTAEVQATVDENLARLRALSVVSVGELIVNLPAEATNCYGPCPGSEPAIAEAKEKAAQRLDNLADVAESAVKSPAPDACADATIDANLAALRALQIVAIDGLIKEEPKAQPSCYNLPCPEDIEAAKAITCERAGKLASIVTASKGL